MKAAVLGASGFIGTHVYNRLIEDGLKVISLGRADTNDIYLDLNDSDSIVQAIQQSKPDYLIHLASPSVQGIYRNNNNLNTDWATGVMSAEIIGSSILFKTAVDNGVKKVIYLSSAAVYGKNKTETPFHEEMYLTPHTLYGAIKLAVEQIGQSLCHNMISLRLFQVYGEGDIKTRLVPSILESKDEMDLQLTPCSQVSDLIYVRDVADCISELIKSEIYSGTFNLGYGKPVVLKDVVGEILEIQNKDIKPNFQAKAYSGTEVTYSCADMSLLFSKIDWRPKYSIAEGIKELVINKNKKDDKRN